jgi:NAD(P)H-hydrate epimerase
MKPVFTAEEMRRLDRRAVEQLGIPGATLMEHAGRGAAQAALDELAQRRIRPRSARVVVVCGKGGNGGDGFVVARHLARAGLRVRVLLTSPPNELTGDAALKYRALRGRAIRPEACDDDRRLDAALATADLVVDAMLGTGARRAPAALIAHAIERINASGRPVIALDLPSGLPADGEAPEWPVIRATLTTTFAGLKRGLVMGPAMAEAGRVQVVSIGIAAAEVESAASAFLLEPDDIAPHFPPRSRDTHKGTYGHLLVVAGSLGKTGAAALAARAAMRGGAGLVTVATAASQQPVIAGLVLEAMTAALPETGARSASTKAQAVVEELAATRDAVALGPGLGLEDDTQELARSLVRRLTRPMVVDADALTAVSGRPELASQAPDARVLTPHPGEMARLLGVHAADVQRDRIAAARELATRCRAHVVLKGATSVIAEPEGPIVLNPTGNPGMASGGTGDVLTGVIGAFLARGLSPAVAARAGVFLHGRAGDLAATRLGEESLVASDVIDALPEAFRSLAASR